MPSVSQPVKPVSIPADLSRLVLIIAPTVICLRLLLIMTDEGMSITKWVPKPDAVYRVVTIAKICVSGHPDYWRSRSSLQRKIESGLAEMLLKVSGRSVDVEHVFIEPAEYDASNN